MQGNPERRGWLRRLLKRVGTLGTPRPSTKSGPRRDDEDDGIGVPVPVGPRPSRGGAHARPPGKSPTR